MAIVPLSCGGEAQVDEVDYDRLSAFSWRRNSKGYAVRDARVEGRKVTVLMHREVLGRTKGDGLQIDHRNCDRLDNRRNNLRVCDYSGNAKNCRARASCRSGFKGVYLKKRRAAHHTDRWIAQIATDKRKVYLGSFDTPEEAHEFYCLAADMLHGDFSNHG